MTLASCATAMPKGALVGAALAALCLSGCFGPVGIVGELDGQAVERMSHSAYTDVLFGGGDSVVWTVIGATPNLCGAIRARLDGGQPCFDGWGETERLHIRLPGRPEGEFAVGGGPCFVAFGDLPPTAMCREGEAGLGLTGIGAASADAGSIAIVSWRELDHLGGRLDVTFPDDSWLLGSFEADYCPELNNCCSQVPGGCF